MGGFDKYLLGLELQKLGWIEVEENYYTPPQSLLKCKKRFNVYDARDLQNMIGVEEIPYE